VNKRNLGIALGRLAAMALGLTLLASVSPAEAGDIGTPPQPYGGCAEAWQAPHSKGADECRDLGWTVRVGPRGHGIVVSPRRVIRYEWLADCRYEDGSRQRAACVWYAGERGNGEGRSYWLDRADRVHYVRN